MARPSNSNSAPKILPVILASTISTNPFRRATIAMINSVALPKSALTNPPRVGPVTRATFSVEVARQTDRGAMAAADVKKIAVSSQSRSLAAIDSGTKTKIESNTRMVDRDMMSLNKNLNYTTVI